MTGVETATWMAISAALSAEGMRKAHVGGKIQERQQDKATKKAEKSAAAQEAKNAKIRQEAAKNKKMVQTEDVTKSPFAGKKKGSMRSQFTVGGGGSGTNY